jgi:hypothetical protein
MASTKPPSRVQTPARNVNHVVLGDLVLKPWNQAIYPADLVTKDTDRLYVCRWCFRYSCDAGAFAQHTRVCKHRTTPPGEKVYDHGGYAVWKVDGQDHKLFGQNLSLFAKLFLDNKTVFFDVATFLFYILTFTDPDPDNSDTYHVLGFFSKEKLSWDANNLACILIFPPYQRKQLGKLLMGVSYKLSGWDMDGGGYIGGPEKPLSDLGQKSYDRFWAERVARYLLREKKDGESKTGESDQKKPTTPKSARKRPLRETMTVEEIGKATGMLNEDVITALKTMGVVKAGSSPKKRKMGRLVADDNAVNIRKSDVWKWAQTHNLALDDPVREDGFLGEWAPKTELEEESLRTSSEPDD